MNVRNRVFLIAGSDFSQRHRAIANIRERILRDKTASLNTLTFYSKEIDISNFQEKLFNFSFDKEKIIILKDAGRLSKDARAFLGNNLEKIISNNYIILETDDDYFSLRRDKKLSSDKFFSIILKDACIIKVLSSSHESSLEDFKRNIRKNDLSAAFHVLEKLFEVNAKDRDFGPLLLGVLVREISYMRDPSARGKYFRYLWEADRNIKEKGMDTRLAIEVLLAKMFGP